ncbi:MAG: hypothetical protein ACI9W2_002148 [Gammaproteobacteria bacterium]|jgi:hypothetical protein
MVPRRSPELRQQAKAIGRCKYPNESPVSNNKRNPKAAAHQLLGNFPHWRVRIDLTSFRFHGVPAVSSRSDG